VQILRWAARVIVPILINLRAPRSGGVPNRCLEYMSRLIELDRQRGDEVAKSVVENLDGELQDRVVPYGLKFLENREPVFPYEKESVLGEAEYEGMMSIFRLGQNHDYIFWFSPPRGRSGYTEGRLVVGRVISRENGLELECRGIPVLEEADRMLEMARDLYIEGGVSESFVNRAEDLREEAIGVNLDEGVDLWDFCEEVLGMREVWQVVREGKDVEMTERVTRVTEEVKMGVERSLGGISSSNSVRAGAMFESMMADRGYRIVGGNHGGLNSAILGGGIFNSVFNEGKRTRISAEGKKLTYCESCKHWYSGDKCPYCS